MLGYAPTTMAGAQDAMRALHDLAPAIVITDVRMPQVNGLELLWWLRELAPDIDVIVTTAHQDMSTALAAMKRGAYDFLVESLDLDQFELVLARCIRDRALRKKVHRLTSEAAEPYELERLVGRDPQMIEI